MSRRAPIATHVALSHVALSHVVLSLIVLSLTTVAYPAAGQPPGTAAEAPTTNKEGTFGSRLLLPFYAVDTVSPGGPTTLWAIRNESTSAVQVTVRYFTNDPPQPPQPPQAQHEEMITLGAKAISTVNIGLIVAPNDLAVDQDGFARGYVTFATTGDEAVIHGDYFLLNDAENFASGSRLVNVDPNSSGNDLCNRFSMRFLDSQLFFDSGTLFTVWADVTEPYLLSYSVYSQAGGAEQLFHSLSVNSVVAQMSANFLMSALPGLDLEFGAIEFQFPGQTVGHVSSVMSAFDRFSVGFEATCLDPT